LIEKGLSAFKGRRILLLQGPIGPFFRRLARDLRGAGAEVWKVNFNGGDWLFQPDGMTYRGPMEEWPGWLGAKLDEHSIDLVLLFGDCRPIHRAALELLKDRGVEVGVFEEGYIRPHYVTLERGGVNGNSSLPRSAEYYASAPARSIYAEPVPRNYWYMVWFGFLYFTIGGLTHWMFPQYRHHRPLTIIEMFPWLSSPLKKWWFAWRERGIEERLSTELSGRYYFVPLQVHNDAQVTEHADVGGVAGFIRSIIASFALHAPADKLLVLKHHPMDRGYVDYTRLIQEAGQAHGCEDRVFYIHDQYTPRIIHHSCGVVVINSTVGLTALAQHKPVKACGDAFYDVPGLTFQGSLESFWSGCVHAVPDARLFRRFRDELIARTQVNGSFYRRLDPNSKGTGLLWMLAEAAETGDDRSTGLRLVGRR
jgi:capsular polysaccharide export protein